MSGERPQRLGVLALAFFALTLPLTWLWLEWGREPYVQLLHALLREMGASAQGATTANAAAPRFVSLVPFVVLMALTPHMSIRRRVWGTVAGVALLGAVHVALLAAVHAAEASHGRGQRSIATFFPFLVLADGAPLLVWLFLARDFVRQLIPGLAEEGRQ